MTYNASRWSIPDQKKRLGGRHYYTRALGCSLICVAPLGTPHPDALYRSWALLCDVDMASLSTICRGA